MDDKKSSLSFGFKKKQDSVQLGKSAVSEDVDKEDKETDYVLSLEGKEVKSTKSSDKIAKQEYVIPLIRHNKWRMGDKIENHLNVSENKDVSLSCVPESLDAQAAKEILQDTAKYNEEWDERGKEDTKLAIPLLVQNRIPDGFESDEKLDVGLRPDEPNDVNYDHIPIEHFGLAMLRGMGWSKDRGIGKNSKVIAPVEAHIRPKGLGLGADRNNSGSDKINTLEKTLGNGEVLQMKKNAFCVVTAGKNKDLYGTVEGIDEDNSRLMLKLVLSGKTVNIMQSNVNVVGKHEFDKYSKYLNKQKADEYKANEKMRKENSEENGDVKKSYRSKSNNSDKRRNLPSDSDSDMCDIKPKKCKQEEKQNGDSGEGQTKHSDRNERNSKYKPHSKFESSSSHSESEQMKNTRETTNVLWLRNDLRVRIIDKELNRGKFYKEKVIIIDVPYWGKCICRTDDGRVIENVSQSSLETIVPRLENAFVAIVAGSHRGQIGQIMKRDKDKCLALVQLLTDRDIVLKLQYDDICEFVGDIQDHDDY